MLELASAFLVLKPSLKTTETIYLLGEALVVAQIRRLTIVHPRLILEVSCQHTLELARHLSGGN